MPTGVDLLAACRSFEGEPYRQINPGRCDPRSGFKDCSGDVVAGHAKLGVYGVPTVSAYQARWCHDNNAMCSVDVALHTPGGLLFRGANRGMDGFGNDGHVAVSAGDGQHVTEARGTAWGVLYDSALGREWDGAGLSPALDYTTMPPPPPKPPRLRFNLIYRQPVMVCDEVVDVKTKLLGWAYICHDPAMVPDTSTAGFGTYGYHASQCVRQFQRRARLAANGIVDQYTFNALYKI